MVSKNTIRVSEFEKLYYDERNPFKKKHWEAVSKFLEKESSKENKGAEYFRILNKGIQFTNYVGVIQAGNLTIEVLPKIDRGTSTAFNETIGNLKKSSPEIYNSKSKWHKVLLEMLRECKKLKVNHVNKANLNFKNNSILEIYIEIFLNEAEKILHEGLTKKYQKQDGNHTALKGKLLFSKQISCNLTHKERFFVRYTEYNKDNLYNRILYKTILLIPNLTSNNYLIDKVGRMLLNFPELSNIKVSQETFNQLIFNRKTERYKEALLISKMLLLNYRPDLSGGSENVIAILFDMNKLWEDFVYSRLKKEESNFDMMVLPQQHQSFWATKILGRPKTIRPDIIIKTKNPIRTIVIDTKWKILDDLIPSDEDLRQMFVYNLYWDCNQAILLYPSKKSSNNHGDYIDFLDKDLFKNKCSVHTTSVLDKDNKLNKDFGTNILKEILGSMEVTNL